MTKAYVLLPGKSEWEPIEIKEHDDYNRILCGWMEGVHMSPKFTIYVNEEGKLNNFPPTAYWVHDGNVHDTIVGPIILIGPPDKKCNDTDATPEMLEEAKKFLHYPVI